ncbi:MAG TPA: hypothetical protein VI316_04080 [Candidatus Dormibacteraeota bacterium]
MTTRARDRSATGDDARDLWDPVFQGRDPGERERAARDALAREWERVWELPLSFLRDKYQAAGMGRDTLPPLDAIPRTSKAELRENERRNPPFGTHRAVPLEHAIRLGSSTGTTGKPTLIFYGARDLEVHIEVGVRNLWRHGVRRGDLFTHSWPQGIYPTNVAGGRTYLAAGVVEIGVGPPVTPEVAAEHLALWDLLRPDAFMMTSAQLRTYEEAEARAGVAVTDLLSGRILVFLEASCQFPHPRLRLEKAYAVSIRNIGGASEIPGLATSDCRFHTGLHAAGDHFILQACDPDTGRELAPGERGVLVVTAFDMDACFIRYDLEDVVVAASDPCPCGETGPRYTLLGRSADVREVAGRKLLPVDVQLALEEFGAPEFRFLPQSTGGALDLEVESDGRGSAVKDVLQLSLGVPVEIKEVETGTLPRSTFKPRRVMG